MRRGWTLRFFKMLFSCLLFVAVNCLEDPVTTAIKADLAAFCSTLGNPAVGSQGVNCKLVNGVIGGCAENVDVVRVIWCVSFH